MQKEIDINCDLGEGMNNDAQLMPLIQSCNIACGGHFGTAETIREAIQLAKKHHVHIGAHPSFPDRENFGRKVMHLPPKELKRSVVEQLNLFLDVCKAEEVEMHHVKLHGALYNLAAKDQETAKVIIDAFREVAVNFYVYTPENSELERQANGYFQVKKEAFIDRTYQKDLNLTPRSDSKALIESPAKAWEQLKGIAFDEKVQTVDGVIRSLRADTFCIHGDGKQSLEILLYIHQKLSRE